MIAKYSIYLLGSMFIILTLGTTEAGIRMTPDPVSIQEAQQELYLLRQKNDTIVDKISEKLENYSIQKDK